MNNITQAQCFRLFPPSVIQIDGNFDSPRMLQLRGLSLMSLV